MFKSNSCSKLSHRVQYLTAPQGSAVALWDFPLTLQTLTYHRCIHLPSSCIQYSFEAPVSTEMKTSWHSHVLSAALSSIMQRTCWLSLAADSPAQQSVEVASKNVFYASIGTARLRFPQRFAITWFVIFPSLRVWHFPWQRARGRNAWWCAACIFISTDSHPPTQTTMYAWTEETTGSSAVFKNCYTTKTNIPKYKAILFTLF